MAFVTFSDNDRRRVGQAIYDVLSDDAGGCFGTPEQADANDGHDCMDGTCYCSQKAKRLANAAMSALRSEAQR